MTLILLDFEDTNNLLDTHLNITSIPSLGLIISPTNICQKKFLDLILEDEAEIYMIL